MATFSESAAADGTTAALTRNVLALTSGLLLWTAGHFGVLAVLPLFLHDQGYDARSIGLTLGATGVAQLGVRPFAGWIVDAFGRRAPLALSLVLLSGAAALLLAPAGWAVLANRLLTGSCLQPGHHRVLRHGDRGGPGRSSQRGAGLRGAGAHAGYRDRAAGSGGALPKPAARGRPPARAAGRDRHRRRRDRAGERGLLHRDRQHVSPPGARASVRTAGQLPPGGVDAGGAQLLRAGNTGFSAFLPLWAIGRGVGNPGLLFIGSEVGAVGSRLLAGRLADRHGRRAVLAPAMIGVGAILVGMSAAVGLPAFFILAVGYGALYGVAFVVLPGLAGEAAPPSGRGAALNTFGLGSDLAQLLGPWGVGLAAATWGFGGALVAAAVVPLFGAAAYLAHVRRLPDRP
jgi:MFS family permease